MVSKISIVIFQICLLSLQLCSTKSQTQIRAAYYWPEVAQFSVSNINSSLFTHLICCCAIPSSTSYEISLSDEEYIPTFTKIVKRKNPSVTTLLSIRGKDADNSVLSSMVNNSSYRRSFIDSSIAKARLYGFEGLDFYWSDPDTASDMLNLPLLFKEWREAVNLESRDSSRSQLILTAKLQDSPDSYSETYRIDTVQQYLNWSHVTTNDYFTPTTNNLTTAAPSALYDPTSLAYTDNYVGKWIRAGLLANKLVIGLPYYGYAWKLANPTVNGIGAPAVGPAISEDGFMEYNEIKNYIERFKARCIYNSTYVVNYCTHESSWIGYDGVEAIREKVSYVKKKGLLGYYVWQVSYDANWELSEAAAQQDAPQQDPISPPPQNPSVSPPQENNKGGQNKRSNRFLVILLPATAAIILLLGLVIYFRRMRKPKSEASVDTVHELRSQVNDTAAAGDFNGHAPTLVLYSLADMEVATDKFSIENKLGEGGYGPVYKGVLPDGQDVAVKKLSKTSIQGFEEFKNEIMLTAKLQHINLVRLLGFCIDKEEHMLVYEYMPNKSLDYYLFDPIRKNILDWKKRIHIIEGVCQGLLYLQEYSRLTIIHRDLKASNVLLDKEMKPKISDFGIARIFSRDGLEANTCRIVGTYGYAPPEYIKNGLYSMKSDVYSFGVLLLQIISGKRLLIICDENNDHLSLLEYAYELWKDDKCMEFMDPSLDDTHCNCRLKRCLHIALLCVQEIPIVRPSMLEVYWMLKNEATDLASPKKPGFSKKTDDQDVQYDSTTSNKTTTVSSLEAR